ncbi:YbaB/EbfC family nucleoid-associated protein [Catenulispora rubra]|uniref:YbaB/EbfC family nucleoid-associated protein n=1 Tax=Catenulispora rubra TaxID=280293 RepID=UPI0018928742|nr:YbaB/EbfC family nucleoid-associated protein [Catenulispora rubra]
MSELPTFATAQSVAQLKALYSQLLDEADDVKARVTDFKQRSAAVEGRARTPEDDIRVTVGPHGDLRTLEIDPRAYRKLGPTELAQEIVELCERAHRDAGEKVGDLMKSALGRDFDVEAYLRGDAQPPRPSRLPSSDLDLGDWLDRLKEGNL